MRDEEGYNKDSYVIKNCHIYCIEDTYEIFHLTIATPINNHLKYLIHDNYCLYFRCKEYGNLEISHEGKIMIHYLIIHHLYQFPQEF